MTCWATLPAIVCAALTDYDVRMISTNVWNSRARMAVYASTRMPISSADVHMGMRVPRVRWILTNVPTIHVNMVERVGIRSACSNVNVCPAIVAIDVNMISMNVVRSHAVTMVSVSIWSMRSCAIALERDSRATYVKAISMIVPPTHAHMERVDAKI